jgi:HEPN/RES N-terminal domain 1/RES domain
MGRVKAWMMEQEERGYWQVDGHVCADCFLDSTLKQYVRDNAISHECDYCDKRSEQPIAAPFDDVMHVILTGIDFEWNNPDSEGILYESAEGGYQAPLSDTYELLHDYEISENDRVLHKIMHSIINEQWVQRDFYIGSEGQRFQWGWEAFRYEITHKKRFVFLYNESEEIDSPEISPSEFLFKLADFKNSHLDSVSLVHGVTTDTDIYRVRISQQRFSKARELGAPPQDRAIYSNRMSPAGIPMFYGAFDIDTAILETHDPSPQEGKKVISIGTFRPLRDLLFLDLAILPPIPSVFDLDRRHMIHALRFFHGFANDIAQPVSRNGREHVEYVPTQVVTEFFRHIYRTSNGERLDGIIYRSSRNEGKRACVIFCENKQACDRNSQRDDSLLQLVRVDYRTL